jgi:acyl transferase domain-containing protein
LSVNWHHITPHGRFLSLPTYPWQKERYWQESEASRQDRLGRSDHPFLNRELTLPHPAWEVELNEHLIPYLNEHRLQNTVVFPGAGYVEAALAMHKKLFDEEGCTLAEVEFHKLLAIDEQQIQFLHLSVQPERNTCAVYSRSKGDDAAWTHHATSRLLPSAVNHHDLVDIEAILERCSVPLSVADLYQTFHHYGLDYGPYFQTIKQGWCGLGEVLVKIEALSQAVNEEHYLLHPTILDAAFQSLLAMVEQEKRKNSTRTLQLTPFVPVSIEKLTFYASPRAEGEVWAHVKTTDSKQNSIESDILLFDEEGHMLVEIRRFRCQAITQEKKANVAPWFYDFKWHLALSLMGMPQPLPQF